jgi:hypothetical protein
MARAIKGFDKARLAMLMSLGRATDIEKLSRHELRQYLEKHLYDLDTQIVALSRLIAMQGQACDFVLQLPKKGEVDDKTQELDYLLATRAAIAEVLDVL